MAPILSLISRQRISYIKTSFTCYQISKLKLTARWFRSQSKGENSSMSKTKSIGLVPAKDVAAAELRTFRSLLKPFLFTVSFCGCCYVGSALWQYENVRRYALLRHLPYHLQPHHKVGNLRRQLNLYWNNLTEGQKLATGIIAANCIVFLLWRVPALQSTLVKYFTASPASKAVCLPMVLSTFSHYSLFHLAANMFVLYSFSTTAVHFFGKEQFLGFYLSAGVVSSFVSYVHKVLTRSASLSLGASGALMGVLAVVCFQYPDSQLSIIFLPFFTFPAGIAMKCIMGLDTVGVALGWKIFDHAAHLGGSLFGAAYLTYGQDYIWRKREPLLNWWHSIRNKGNNK